MDHAAAAPGVGTLDTRPLGRLQLQALLLCGLVAVLDGNDTQLMGIGAPSIAAALHVAPSAMGWAFSGSWIGAAAGALVFGRAADLLGRKTVLMAAIAFFGLFTLLTPLADSLTTLTAYRVLAGIGLGGATPCFIALASEYAPARIRGRVVSLVWAAFPLGLLLGGLLNGWLLAIADWQMIFYAGGALSLALVLLLAPLLPESLAFLLLRRSGSAETRRVLAALGLDEVPAAAAMVRQPLRRQGGGFGELVSAGRLRSTLCLWLMLFACFGTTATMSWIPTILRQHGVSPATAAVAISFLGLGALLGMAIAGQLVDRFGAAKGLVAPTVLGALSTAALGYWPGSPVAASVFVGLVGALVGLGASGAIALIAIVYPADVRSTGAGWAMGMGRLGQGIMPGLFALLLGTHWDVSVIFVMLGVLPLLGAVAALFVEPKSSLDRRIAGYAAGAPLGSPGPKAL